MTRARTEKITETAKTVPNCPPTAIRWVALLPDPVTGLDAPVRAINGQPMIWTAADLEAARQQVKAVLLPNAFRLCSVVSVVDWTERQHTPQRRKLSREPGFDRPRLLRNVAQICEFCGGRTATPYARFCPPHRQPRHRKHGLL